jgi:hypothetical protein
MVEYLGELEARIVRNRGHLSSLVTTSVSRCMGHVPQVGRAARLHRCSAGCPSAEPDACERRMGPAILPAWREVLVPPRSEEPAPPTTGAERDFLLQGRAGASGKATLVGLSRVDPPRPAQQQGEPHHGQHGNQQY